MSVGAALNVPPVYALDPIPRRLGVAGRLVALLVLLACSVVLVMAAIATPDPTGIGTHTALGLEKCGWLATRGYPCPSCGMTTSFAWFVRGNVAASIYVQPMGFLLATLTAMTWWAAGYLLVSGRPAHAMLRFIPPLPAAVVTVALTLAAWGWKIFIHAHGLDGWR